MGFIRCLIRLSSLCYGFTFKEKSEVTPIRWLCGYCYAPEAVDLGLIPGRVKPITHNNHWYMWSRYKYIEAYCL